MPRRCRERSAGHPREESDILNTFGWAGRGRWRLTGTYIVADANVGTGAILRVTLQVVN